MALLRHTRLYVPSTRRFCRTWVPGAVAGALVVSTVVGCGGEDTYTPDACPPLHEYDIRELYAEENLNDPTIARQRAGIEDEVEKAAAEGCVTKATFTPPLD
jgi:hypothetical protein